MKKYKSVFKEALTSNQIMWSLLNARDEYEDFVYSQGITDPKKSDVNDFVKQYKLNNSQKNEILLELEQIRMNLIP